MTLIDQIKLIAEHANYKALVDIQREEIEGLKEKVEILEKQRDGFASLCEKIIKDVQSAHETRGAILARLKVAHGE